MRMRRVLLPFLCEQDTMVYSLSYCKKESTSSGPLTTFCGLQEVLLWDVQPAATHPTAKQT